VNNAGIISTISFEKLRIEDWRKILAVNLDSVFMCSQEVAGYMKKRRYGKIISISSIAGQEGGMFSSPAYAVSKAGIICLTKCMARALAKYNIMVNAIAPGAIETGMTGRWTDEERKRNLGIIPLGRFGSPEDVGNLAVFLASAESDYVTGHTINVDGGKVM
jgi:3-oxoacyl-[acyl-carrier protein] reductase